MKTGNLPDPVLPQNNNRMRNPSPSQSINAPSCDSLPDILLPQALQRRWKERIRPTLEALGIPGSTDLDTILGDPCEARIWLLRARRPKVGSVVLPRPSGRSCRCGDAIVRQNKDAERIEKGAKVVVTSGYSLSVMARVAPSEAEEQAEWEDVPQLAVSNDFVTLVADILPEKDAFIATEIWANAAMPIYALAQCPVDLQPSGSLRSFKLLDKLGVHLAKKCKNCSSSGKVECKRCDGHGTWQPDGHCSLCGGNGKVTCNRCGGTGDFIGKFGDRMGDCNSCGGRGKRTCPRCDGSGEPPILDCNACSGSGLWDCNVCEATGMVEVGFHTVSGQYTYKSKGVPAGKIFGWDENADQEYDLEQGAGLILQRLEAQAEVQAAAAARLQSVQSEISPIANCLTLAMQAQDKPPELFNFPPVQLVGPEATIHRRKGRVIYAFGLPRPRVWARDERLPFDEGTPVKFTLDKQKKEVIELARQGKTDDKMPVDPVLAGIEMRNNRPALLISFPKDVDPTALENGSFLSPDSIPPAELAQLKELGKWCSGQGSVPQLSHLVRHEPNGDLPASPEAVMPEDPAIKANPRQHEALNWILSDAPLVLIKGPPGTGKTTVITEAVLRCIERGQKILVCSETHQAVCNVLERLHKNGRIRMIRHARKASHQLTELEQDYLEGGSRQAYLSEIRNRTATSIKEQVRRLRGLEHLISLLPQAVEASRRLEDSRNEAARVIRAADDESQFRIRKIEADKDASCAEAEARHAAEMKPLRKQDSRLAARVKAAMKKKGGLEVAKANIHRTYLNKTGNEPAPKYSAASRSSIIDSMIPNAFASADRLHERFARTSAALVEADRELVESEGLLEDTRREQARSVADRDRALATFEMSARDATAAALKDRNIVQRSATDTLRKDEAAYLMPQEKTARLWNEIGGLTPVEPDLPPTEWERLHQIATAEKEATDARHHFSSRWHDAMDSAESTLCKIFWDTTDVFLSTCVGLASWRTFAENFDGAGVDLAIIDEAAHATLTQTLIPLRRAKRAILIGDEMQLPPAAPMELGRRCEESCPARCQSIRDCLPDNRFKPTMSDCWLERSAFEWLSETRPWIPRVMLDRQFRMHPEIADFVAQVIYNGELKSGVTANQRTLSFGVFNRAVCLISTSAYKNRFEYVPAGQSSYQNELEVEMVKRVLEEARRHLETPVSIGVLTPYAAQKELARKSLSDLYSTKGNLRFQEEDIASVDSFQGSERDVMVASFVRSPERSPRKCKGCEGTGEAEGGSCPACRGSGWLGPKLNWVHDLRRLNVAFSRARSMLILIGDVKALVDPRFGASTGREVLSRFEKYVADHGKVLHVWEDSEDD